MSGSSRDPRHEPQRGDVILRDGKTYRVVSRGVANSVRFVRTSGKHSLLGQKSIGCWRRLAQGSQVLVVAG